jgi:phosphohistidine phosphatase
MRHDLLLLRHAKSDWDAGAGRDHDRPLAPRGIAAAGRVGQWLAAAGPALDLVVTSSAVRALETARLALREGRLATPLRVEPSFYGSDVAAMLEAVRGLDEALAGVLLVGHEPTWSALASLLIGGGNVRMPTAAVAGIRFEVGSWGDVEPGAGELRFLLSPKVFGE